MIIYLYVKTHNKTGLKYLGKTTRKDPFKYLGSGKWWLRHLSKYGNDITTAILLATEDKEDIKQTGIFFSKLWGVAKSKEWANIVIEKGDGISSEYATELNNRRIEDRTHNLLGKQNPSHRKIQNGEHHFQNKEWQQKHSKQRMQTMKSNGTHYFSSTESKKAVTELSRKRVKDGTHNFLTKSSNAFAPVKNTLLCVDKMGQNVWITSQLYKSQIGDPITWEYVTARSFEGKRRKLSCVNI